MRPEGADRPSDESIVLAVGENCCNSCHNGSVLSNDAKLAAHIAEHLPGRLGLACHLVPLFQDRACGIRRLPGAIQAALLVEFK